jgi:hypothetical protein
VDLKQMPGTSLALGGVEHRSSRDGDGGNQLRAMMGPAWVGSRDGSAQRLDLCHVDALRSSAPRASTQVAGT